jgi:lambda family phage portal protein
MSLPVVRNSIVPNVQPNLLDRAIGYFAPERAANRLQSRMMSAVASNFMATMSGGGGYDGGARNRRETNTWLPFSSDADTATLSDLNDMRGRCRDAVRNFPIAAGAISSTVTAVIGSGLTLQPAIDRSSLKMDDTQAEDWQRSTEREWRLFSQSKECDWSREFNLNGLGELAFRSALENGDVFVSLPRKLRGRNPYSLCLQLIEADRVCNPNFALDSATMVGGVEKDQTTGEPVAYHVLKGHPGNLLYIDQGRWEWDRIPAYDTKTNLPNIIHLKRPMRIGQTRTAPFLAPVLEPLRMITRYSQAELMAAVVSAMFTVFVKIPSGVGLGNMTPAPLGSGNGVVNYGPGTTTNVTGGDIQLGNGAVIDLAPGEEIQIAESTRPNSGFDPFFLAIVRQIGVALEIPYEVLVQHFTASYSAARMAVEQAWVFYLGRRSWLVDNFYAIIYEMFMTEAVALRRIAAPGFLSSPTMRMAYLGAQWTGPKKPQVDPVKEANAAKIRVEEEFSTRAIEASGLTCTDWETNHIQRAKEERMRRADGTEMDSRTAVAMPIEPAQNQELPEAA